MKTIEMEDSLQHLASLTMEERIRIVDKTIANEAELKRKQKEQEQSNQIFDPSKQSVINSNNNASGSNWYFYNAQSIGFGYNEFQKKFGKRKLEDNWRRSKKQSEAGSQEEQQNVEAILPVTPGDTSAGTASAGNNERETLLNNIPATPEAIDKSTGKIVEAYYNIGMIYREQLNDLKASAAAFEELLRRYPANKYQLQCYYQLYRTYAVLGNKAKSEYYKNIILNEHGETEYAEIIRNPNYAAEKANRKSNLDIFYEETYRKYLNGEYASVIKRKDESDVQFPQNILTPKFDFLKTLSIGRTQPLNVFEASLNDIIRNYSNDSVRYTAQDILDFIKANGTSNFTGGEAPVPANDTTSANKKIFTYQPDTLHYVILIFQNIGGPLNPEKLKYKISDFNGANFSNKVVKLDDFLFDHRNKIFVLKTFSNKQEALQYRNVLYDNDAVFGQIPPDAYKLFVISVNNMPQLITLKKTDSYEDFYRQFYQ